MPAKTVKNNQMSRPKAFRGMRKGDVSSAETINSLATEMIMSQSTDPNQKAAWARIVLATLEHINSQPPSAEDMEKCMKSFMEDDVDAT